MFSPDQIKAGSDFMMSISHLMTLDTTQQMRIQDQHFINIRTALNMQLQFKPQHLQKTFQQMVLIMQSQQNDEFIIQESLQIIDILVDKHWTTINQTCQQFVIILISKILNSLNQLPQQIIHLPLHTLSMILKKQPELIGTCIPQLSSKILALLLEKPQSKIQLYGTNILGQLLSFVIHQSPAQVEKPPIISLRNDNKEPITQIKLNEMFLTFCQTINHLLTPKLCSIYQEFSLNLLKCDKILNFFHLETYHNTLKLYIQFSPSNLDHMKILLKVIRDQNTLNEYAKIKLFRLILNDLRSTLKTLTKASEEIDPQNIFVTLKALKYQTFLITEFDQDYLNNELQELFCQQLQKALKYKFNTKIRLVVQNINKQEYSTEIPQKISSQEFQIRKLNLEMMPFLNYDHKVWNEMQKLFNHFNQTFLLQMIDRIVLELFEEIDKLKVVFSSKFQALTIPINLILKICSQLFLVNRLLESVLQQCVGYYEQDWLLKYLEQKPKISHLSSIKRIQNELYNLVYSTNFDNRDQVVELLNVQILQGIFFCYLLQGQSEDIFERTQLLEFIFKCGSMDILSLSTIVDLIISFSGMTFNSDQQISSLIDQYAPSIIQRSLNLLHNIHLQSDKAGPLRLIRYLLQTYPRTCQIQTQILKLLTSLSDIFDKYYLNSDIQFVEQFIRFIAEIFKKWRLTSISNELIMIVRKIILQTHQFYNHPQLALSAVQCFFHVIPILANQPLTESSSDQSYGMNDGGNVTISDTLAVTFFEVRKVFENSLLDDTVQKTQLQFWKILQRIYQIDDQLVFFQTKNILLWYHTYMKITLDKYPETLVMLKCHEEILKFLLLYLSLQQNKAEEPQIGNKIKTQIQDDLVSYLVNIQEKFQPIELAKHKCLQIEGICQQIMSL